MNKAWFNLKFVDLDAVVESNNNVHSGDFYTSNGGQGRYGNGNFLFFVVPNNNLGMASAQATDGELNIADFVLGKFWLLPSSDKSKIICVSQHLN